MIRQFSVVCVCEGTAAPDIRSNEWVNVQSTRPNPLQFSIKVIGHVRAAPENPPFNQLVEDKRATVSFIQHKYWSAVRNLQCRFSNTPLIKNKLLHHVWGY